MVENPASAVGAEIAAHAKEEDASIDRLVDLATKGTRDPAALKPEEVQDLCAAFLKNTARRDG